MDTGKSVLAFWKLKESKNSPSVLDIWKTLEQKPLSIKIVSSSEKN